MKASRVAVISDLHLGGEPPWMTSRPERLAGLIDRLPSELASDEEPELVIDGDFVDFLAIPPWRAFTQDEGEALGKLMRTMEGSPFGQVFDALARWVGAGRRLVILLGNHDLELALPPLQQALRERLGGDPHRVVFFCDGLAYRVGAALIEHGNRYDVVNANDWSGLRAVASALSRFEEPRVEVIASPGSRLVERFINPLKRRYPFIELLKPNGELVPLLLAAFEPSLLAHSEHLAWLMRRVVLHPGPAPRLAYSALAERDPELASEFGEVYERLQAPSPSVPLRAWAELMFEPRRDGLAHLLETGQRVPPRRLRQIRLLLGRLLLDDRSAELDGPTGPWGRAALELLASSRGAVTTVVMGHTHLARRIGPDDRAHYLNTGTWADVLRIPTAALDGDDAQLEALLRSLLEGAGRDSPANWADLRVEADGQVRWARLRTEP